VTFQLSIEYGYLDLTLKLSQNAAHEVKVISSGLQPLDDLYDWIKKEVGDFRLRRYENAQEVSRKTQKGNGWKRPYLHSIRQKDFRFRRATP